MSPDSGIEHTTTSPFLSDATNWGTQKEPVAIQEYTTYQRDQDRDIIVGPCGFMVCESHLFLEATPDGTVQDLSDTKQPFGFIEVKCPYTQGDCTPIEATKSPGFCCELQLNSDSTQTLKLE